MDPLNIPLNPYLLLSLLLLATTLYLLLQPHPTTGLARWLQRKNYQYEVTSSLYMLTPTEKFVFSTSSSHSSSSFAFPSPFCDKHQN